MSRPREPFRTTWRRLVWKTQLVTNTTRLLLLLLSDYMDDDGRVSVPRSELAATLGRSEQSIKTRTMAAIEAKLLVQVGRGHQGRTAVYQARFPAGIGVRNLYPYSVREGVRNRTPINGDSSTTGRTPITTADLSSVGSARVGSTDEDEGLRGEQSEPAEGRMNESLVDPSIGPWQLADKAVGLQPSDDIGVDIEAEARGGGGLGEGVVTRPVT